jgi:hypothetical protein
MVETRRFQAMGQLNSTCTTPPRKGKKRVFVTRTIQRIRFRMRIRIFRTRRRRGVICLRVRVVHGVNVRERGVQGSAGVVRREERHVVGVEQAPALGAFNHRHPEVALPLVHVQRAARVRRRLRGRVRTSSRSCHAVVSRQSSGTR